MKIIFDFPEFPDSTKCIVQFNENKSVTYDVCDIKQIIGCDKVYRPGCIIPEIEYNGKMDLIIKASFHNIRPLGILDEEVK